jgi:hypothetical protein
MLGLHCLAVAFVLRATACRGQVSLKRVLVKERAVAERADGPHCCNQIFPHSESIRYPRRRDTACVEGGGVWFGMVQACGQATGRPRRRPLHADGGGAPPTRPPAAPLNASSKKRVMSSAVSGGSLCGVSDRLHRNHEILTFQCLHALQTTHSLPDGPYERYGHG